MDKQEHLHQLRGQAALLRSLVETEGWKWLVSLQQQQCEVRLTDLVLTAPEGLDSLVKKEFALGEIAGLRLMANLPELTLAALNEEIEQISDEIEEERDERRDDESGTDSYPIG